MTSLVKGKTKAEAETMIEQFQDLVTMPMDQQPDEDKLGKLAVFAGVREFPARIKCASLAWHTLKAAIEQQPKAISTE